MLGEFDEYPSGMEAAKHKLREHYPDCKILEEAEE